MTANRVNPEGGSMKKAALFLAVAALAAAALFAARTSASASPQGVAKALPCTGLPIGFMGPITGPVAFLGDEQLHWAQFSLDEFNRTKGTSFTLDQVDTQLNPALAQTGATKLSADKSVLVTVGPAGSQEVQAVGPIFKKAGIGFVSASATNATLTNGKIPTFFRVVGGDNAQATTDALFMVKKLHAKRVFIVDDQESYSTGVANTAGKVLKSKGVKVDRQSVSQKVTDFSSLVSKIADDTTVVFLPWQVAANAQLFYTQMKEQGKNAKIFGSDGTDSGDFKAPGRYLSSFARDIRGTPGTAGLIKRYESRYGNKWGTFGPPAFVAMQAVMTAMKTACADNKASRPEVLAALHHVKIGKTILGQPLSFDKHGDNPAAKFYVYRITGSKRTLVG
jgi:branched-chain amino acid transport system substrate-binding protein